MNYKFTPSLFLLVVTGIVIGAVFGLYRTVRDEKNPTRRTISASTTQEGEWRCIYTGRNTYVYLYKYDGAQYLYTFSSDATVTSVVKHK